MSTPEPQVLLQVTVAYSLSPRQVAECFLEVPQGTVVAEALALFQSRSELHPPAVEISDSTVCGIWGVKVARDQVLTDGDRLEIYRSLRVDPKKARRQRFAQQGAKSAGLFSSRRPGAKAGY